MSLEMSTTREAASMNLSILVDGVPKVGKTGLLRTLPLEKDSDLLYVPADPGDLILRDRDFPRVSPPGNIWTRDALTELYKLVTLAGANGTYKWVAIDGLDDLGIAILNEFKKNTSNLQKAYGEMADFMDSWVKMMRDINGINIIFITHIKTDYDADGKAHHTPAFPGKKMAGELDKYFDIILAMRFKETEEGVVRTLQTSSQGDPSYLCGDRSGSLDIFEEPNLASIIEKIQQSIPGSMSAVIDERMRLIAKLKGLFMGDEETRKLIRDELKARKAKTPNDLDDAGLREVLTIAGGE